jgi:hypothetical protein
MAEDNVSLLELYCLIRDLEATNALSSEVTSVASALAERLSAEDQVQLAPCGWNGQFERGITSSELFSLLSKDPLDGGIQVPDNGQTAPFPTTPSPATPALPLIPQPAAPALSLPEGYNVASEFDIETTFSGPGHVMLWAKENDLWPKKGNVTQWNWFFDALLGPDAAPKGGRQRLVPKDIINDKVQLLPYPITFSHRKADMSEHLTRFSKSKAGVCDATDFAPAELSVADAQDGVCYGLDTVDVYLPGFSSMLCLYAGQQRNRMVWSAYCLIRAIINAVARPSMHIRCFVVFKDGMKLNWCDYVLPDNLELVIL